MIICKRNSRSTHHTKDRRRCGPKTLAAQSQSQHALISVFKKNPGLARLSPVEVSAEPVLRTEHQHLDSTISHLDCKEDVAGAIIIECNVSTTPVGSPHRYDTGEIGSNKEEGVCAYAAVPLCVCCACRCCCAVRCRSANEQNLDDLAWHQNSRSGRAKERLLCTFPY